MDFRLFSLAPTAYIYVYVYRSPMVIVIKN